MKYSETLKYSVADSANKTDCPCPVSSFSVRSAPGGTVGRARGSVWLIKLGGGCEEKALPFSCEDLNLSPTFMIFRAYQ